MVATNGLSTVTATTTGELLWTSPNPSVKSTSPRSSPAPFEHNPVSPVARKVPSGSAVAENPNWPFDGNGHRTSTRDTATPARGATIHANSPDTVTPDAGATNEPTATVSTSVVDVAVAMPPSESVPVTSTRYTPSATTTPPSSNPSQVVVLLEAVVVPHGPLPECDTPVSRVRTMTSATFLTTMSTLAFREMQ